MKMRRSILAAAFVLAAAAAFAQSEPQDQPEGQPQPGGPPAIQQGGPCPMRQGGMQQGRPMSDPLMENFFPPELVMQNQQALGLSDDQKKTIREIMQKSMAEFTDLQWQQSSEQEALAEMLRKAGDFKEKVDEAKVLEQLDKLTKLENQAKHLHLSVMIKIRNTLTPDQLERLNHIKRSSMMGGPRNQMHQGAQRGPGPNAQKPTIAMPPHSQPQQ